MEREPGFSGDAGVDNHGNRFTGEYRLRTNLQWDSPFLFGDQVNVRTLYSDEDMWLASVGYSLPLGNSGLRGNIGFSKTAYELGKDYGGRGEGTAKVASTGLSYPLIRSQKANLNLSGTFQYKNLHDEKVTETERKSSKNLQLALNFDRRDALWGGGITYGSLTRTVGELKLDDNFKGANGKTLKEGDESSGQRTHGHFDKWNLDIARVQATPVANLSLFGRISAQWAGKNLDSSEGFSLGGANGVRAYPSGEGNGDEGWLAQLELRYAEGPYSPYIFHDLGWARTNADNNGLAIPASPNHRSLSGSGAGLRYTAGEWNLDATLAWRTRGGAAQSDGARRDPRLWVAMGYKF